ncbi:uncharacterized protein G2W53_043137 [Senna tora]|uniref:Uncharacterized protein n=1 Tax=Senna tora TaxID=362788 RepID=A0A834SID6_9FABA|nr:uncharacterized protein G2W53_043137 [Senna tora]
MGDISLKKIGLEEKMGQQKN